MNLNNVERHTVSGGSQYRAGSKKAGGKNASQKGNKIVPVDRGNFETFHAIKRDVEDSEAKEFKKHYWFKVIQYVYSSWVPQAREGALLMNEPGTQKFYLYGGVANEPMRGIAKLVTVASSEQCKWDILTEENKSLKYVCDADKLGGRYGFQGAYHKGKIYFFFGCQVYDALRKERDCVSEIVVFDPVKSEVSLR